jgi:hypothetical protein
MHSKDFQKGLFTLIEKQIHPRKLSAEIGSLLSLTPSATYRRLSGDTYLSIEELLNLTTHFGISFEQLTNSLAVSFELPSLQNYPQNIGDYLNQIEAHLIELTSFPECKMRFAALEVPFYYYLSFPPLAAFKFYMWGRTLWQADNRNHDKFHFQKMSKNPNFRNQIEKMAALSNQIQTEEIWNSNMLDITLNQIQYCLSAGLFQNPEEANQLVEEMRNLIKHLENITVNGQKTTHQPKQYHKIYYNELFQHGMFILTETPKTKKFFYTFNIPYFMVSQNTTMYAVGLDFFNRMKSYSLDVMDSNEVNRHKLIRRLNRKVDIFEEELVA